MGNINFFLNLMNSLALTKEPRLFSVRVILLCVHYLKVLQEVRKNNNFIKCTLFFSVGFICKLVYKVCNALALYIFVGSFTALITQS